MFINKFKAPIYVVIDLLFKKRYIFRDVDNHRKPREYV